MGRVEVFENGQTFFKVRDDRCFDDFAIRLRHQTTHTAQLFHLCDRATRTGVGHHVNAVWFTFRAVFVACRSRDGCHHRLGDFVVRLRPSINNFVVLFTLSNQAVHVLLFKVFNLITCFVDQCPLGVRNNHVVLTERDASLKRFAETHSHDLVTEDDGFFLTTVTVDRIDDLLNFLLTQKTVHQFKRRLVVQWQKRAQTNTARCGFETLHDLLAFIVDLRHTCLDLCVQVHLTSGQCVLDLFDGAERHAFADHAFTFDGRVVQTQNHILRRNNDRCAVCRRQNVVRGHHQNACFELCFQGKRYVNSHLVTVEVSVKRRTYKRVQLDRFTFDQNRFERLNTKTVQCRRTV